MSVCIIVAYVVFGAAVFNGFEYNLEKADNEVLQRDCGGLGNVRIACDVSWSGEGGSPDVEGVPLLWHSHGMHGDGWVPGN